MDTRTRSRRTARWLTPVLFLILTLMLSSCSGMMSGGENEGVAQRSEPGVTMYNESAVHSGYAPEAPAENLDEAGADASTVPAEDRYIIRTVGIRLQVEDVDNAVQGVRDAITAAEGMVASLQISTDEDTPIYRYEDVGALSDGTPLSGYIVARVPADSLDSFLAAVSKLGTVQRQAEDESDVTQEHIDLSARLETFKAQEKRLREFFDKAQKVEEMLAIEQELTRVRGEIESLTAQVAYLERQAAMATVTVELATRPPVVSPGGADWGFVDALTQGVRGLVNTINGLIVFLLSALPVLLLIGVVVLLVLRVARRRKRRETEVASPVDDAGRTAGPSSGSDG